MALWFIGPVWMFCGTMLLIAFLYSMDFMQWGASEVPPPELSAPADELKMA